MAGLTIELDMSAIEFVIALGIVVELPDAPPVGVVTGIAFVAESALVNVVLFVACAATKRVQFVVGG